MKLTTPCTFNRPTAIKPPIGLERPPTPRFNKDQIQTFKCKNEHTNCDSAQYKIAVPYFSTGTLEEWIYFQQCLKRAITGQGDTSGPQ